MLVKACLNGSRARGDHQALPIDAAAVSRDAARVVDAGAGAVHVHPRDARGDESIDPAAVAVVVRAIRARCPGLPIGVTTGAWIEPDIERRLAALRGWTELPDFASVNLSEGGALRVIDLLSERGVGVEAGVGSLDDAHLYVDEGLDAACMRTLVEIDPFDTAAEALRMAAEIDAILDIDLAESPRLHHGSGLTTWAVIAAAIERGHDVRIGLEDTLVDDRGRIVQDNAALVAAVVRMARDAGRDVQHG